MANDAVNHTYLMKPQKQQQQPQKDEDLKG